uniref:Glycosyltransferase family 9 protein n=1 Tax=Candidatus Desulfatibia profunda TaxID=2841695 RepID=A0A8J6TKE1_9BACT|nr:glycosyltransferase family 9 protein [Candidatus Desulfatibia profunda]
MNILVIRMHRFGDILQLTPMLLGLKNKYPFCSITFLTGSEMSELLADNPAVDKVISIPEREYRYWLKNSPEEYPRIFNAMYDLISRLRQKHFQIVVNRQYEWGAIIAHLIGAEKVLGGAYSPDKGYFFKDDTSKNLFDTIRNDRRLNQRNLVDWACRIVRIPHEQNRRMLFCPSSFAYRQARHLLNHDKNRSKRSMVAVQTGAAKSFRQWGVENYTHIVQWLIDEKERTVVLVGSEDEKDLGEHIEHRIGRQKAELINLIGRTSLNSLGGVLESCECLITGDTGTMHMAAAVGTPVLSLFFGTAYPWETGPYGTGHFVLYSDISCAPCIGPAFCQDGHRCKYQIKPDIVKKAFESADAFWKNNLVYWEPYNNGVKLLVTVRDEMGEQMLLPVDKASNLRLEFSRMVPRQDDMEPNDAEALIHKGDEVVCAFLKGEDEKGFLIFTEYLDLWLEAKDLLLSGYPAMGQTLSGLLEGCFYAMQNKDPVSLMDAVEYGFKPLIQQTLVKGQG